MSERVSKLKIAPKSPLLNKDAPSKGKKGLADDDGELEETGRLKEMLEKEKPKA